MLNKSDIEYIEGKFSLIRLKYYPSYFFKHSTHKFWCNFLPWIRFPKLQKFLRIEKDYYLTFVSPLLYSISNWAERNMEDSIRKFLRRNYLTFNKKYITYYEDYGIFRGYKVPEMELFNTYSSLTIHQNILNNHFEMKYKSYDCNLQKMVKKETIREDIDKFYSILTQHPKYGSEIRDDSIDEILS